MSSMRECVNVSVREFIYIYIYLYMYVYMYVWMEAQCCDWINAWGMSKKGEEWEKGLYDH